MPNLFNTWRVELTQAAPFDIPQPAPVDLFPLVTRSGFGYINRALERDLLAFKTGDLTLALRNPHGVLDSLFSTLTPTTRWTLRVYRGGGATPIFSGLLLGMGSVRFNDKEHTCEVTAYGLTRLLVDSGASVVQRGTIATTLVSASGGSPNTVTLGSTAGLLSSDMLHITDHVNAEDFVILQVLNATQVTTPNPLSNSYAVGTVVTLTTPFYRYKSVDFLIRNLAAAANTPIAELSLTQSLFNRCAPTPVNLSGLPSFSLDIRRGLVQKGGRRVQSIVGTGTYSQGNPDEAWVQDDATESGYYDWSKYYPEGSAEPPVHLRDPGPASGGGVDGEVSGNGDLTKQSSGADFVTPTTKSVYAINVSPSPAQLAKSTTTNGTTWSVLNTVANLPAAASPAEEFSACAEYDPVRNFVICSWTDAGGANASLYYWDIAGAAWVNMKPAGDPAGTGYFGPVYCADIDAVLVLKGTNRLGPNFTICAFRGAAKLWERPFPSCALNRNPATNIRTFYPTRSIRSVNGRLYAVLVSDGMLQFLSADSAFQSYTMSPVFQSPSLVHAVSARINGAYCFVAYDGVNANGHSIAAPFYAGVIKYADFANISLAEGLKRVAVITNSNFYLDDNGALHVVARDLIPSRPVIDIGDRRREQNRVRIWDQVVNFVTVTGGGFTCVSGQQRFAGSGVSLSSEFIPNAAFCQALADALLSYYSEDRRYAEEILRDPDGHVFFPMDRVMCDGRRWLVYQSNHAPTDRGVTLQLVEDP